MKLKKEYTNSIIGKRINGKMIEFDTNKGNYEYYYKNGFEECFDIDRVEYQLGDFTVGVEKVEEPIKKKVIKYVGIKQDPSDHTGNLDANEEENS